MCKERAGPGRHGVVAVRPYKKTWERNTDGHWLRFLVLRISTRRRRVDASAKRHIFTVGEEGRALG